ncbi:hypothetical protein MARINOS108_11134 [Marinoscillum sp. 108]|nr:hypothetical protein MARINOS108_11134 [Marinoscillum sp. 108]
MRKNSRLNYSLSIDQEEPPIGEAFFVGGGGKIIVWPYS